MRGSDSGKRGLGAAVAGSRRGPRVPSPAAVPSLCPVPAALPHGCALRRQRDGEQLLLTPSRERGCSVSRDAAKQQPWLLNAAEEGRASANTFTGLHTPAGCHAPGFEETLQLFWVQSVRPRPSLRLETLNSSFKEGRETTKIAWKRLISVGANLQSTTFLSS